MNRAFGRRDILKAMAVATLLGHVTRADDTEELPERIVDAMNAIFGKHPGFRSAHAKGFVCEGEFMPSATAASLSKAPHLQGGGGKATIRFSDSTGLPNIPDGAAGASPHGMAVRFSLSDGRTTDIVTNAFNGFAVANGEDFLALLRAIAESGKDEPKPTPLDKFLDAHPKIKEVVTAPKPTPASFATEPYFAVNAFRFTKGEGKSRYGRYQFHPEASSKFLTVDEAAAKPANFLIDELSDRLAKGPVKFRLVVQLANEGDPVTNATAVWPNDRPIIELGILSVTRKVADSDAAQRTLGFDPLRLIDGIEPSDDPLLELRAAVYAVSRRRRKQP
jgi:catalase